MVYEDVTPRFDPLKTNEYNHCSERKAKSAARSSKPLGYQKISLAITMPKKFKLRLQDPIHWPQKCAICLRPCNSTAKAHGGTFAGLSIGPYTPQINYFKAHALFPICTKHKWLNMLYRIIMFTSCLASIFSGMSIIGSHIDNANITKPTFYFLSSIIILFISIQLQAVRIKNIGQYFITLVIRNNEYANEFSQINNIIKK
jgi:hypothetical protein